MSSAENESLGCVEPMQNSVESLNVKKFFSKVFFQMQKIGLDAFIEPGCIISTPRVLIELKLKKLKEIPSSLKAHASAKPFEIWLVPVLWARDSNL